MKKIAILASHNGSGLDALQEAINQKILDLEICVVISNNSEAIVLQKAKKLGIAQFVVNTKLFEKSDQKIYEVLTQYQCEYVFLSGYMKKLSSLLTDHFTIINSHPSLLPKYGGKGMYGSFVHEAVIANKETQSGVTLHFVNEEYDEGEFILQRSINLSSDESAKTLETKIKELEKKVIVEGFLKLLSSSQ